MAKPVIVFLCVHNACRSQIAEAFARKFLAPRYEICSAGTAPSGRIDENAQRLMKEYFGIDMKKNGQYSKPLSKLPSHVDWVITMGCGIKAPMVVGTGREDWPFPDPTGQPDEHYE